MEVDRNRTQTNYHQFLANNDARAWEEFYMVYFQMMVWWAREWGCSEEEARDLAQEKVVQLFSREQFSGFRSQGSFSFRRWLKRIITNEAKSYLKRARRFNTKSADDELPSLEETLADESDDDWDHEDRQFYLKCAVNRALRSSIAQRSANEYTIFHKRVIQRVPKLEVCGSLGIEPATHDVYLGRFRKHLAGELARIFNDEKNYLGPISEVLTETALSDILQEIYAENNGRLDTMLQEQTLQQDVVGEELRSLLRLVSENRPPTLEGDWLLVLYQGGKDWFEMADGTQIGRSNENDVVLSGDGVSSFHASIQGRSGAWRIRDERSTNHVFLNGKRIGAEAALAPGDWLQISTACLIYVGSVSSILDGE